MSGEMVRAALREIDPKTMTRRVIKPQPTFDMPDFRGSWAWNYKAAKYRGGLPYKTECPYGKIGDRLWVRETFAPEKMVNGSDYAYRASGDIIGCDRWTPSIFMPRRASRITLEITNIRVERLQDISEEDAKKEGVLFHDGLGVGHSGYRFSHDFVSVYATAKRAFQFLWDKINGKKYPMESNPWVWVIEFKRIKS